MFAYKTSRRKEDDIAIVTAAFRVLLKQAGDKYVVDTASLAFGGMNKIPVLYATKAIFYTYVY